MFQHEVVNTSSLSNVSAQEEDSGQRQQNYEPYDLTPLYMDSQQNGKPISDHPEDEQQQSIPNLYQQQQTRESQQQAQIQQSSSDERRIQVIENEDLLMEDSKREIHIAAQRGDEAWIKNIIERGANLHVQTKNGETALHIVARQNFDLIVNDLMLNGGVSSIKDKHGRTALHVACAHGSLGATKVLLNFQADLTAKDIDGMSPLHLAAQYNQPQIVEILARRKADLSIRVSHNMYAPIHVAVQHNSRAALEALIDQGANPNLRAWSGHTPLHVAVESGSKGLIAILVGRGAEINQRLTNGRSTPLTMAIDLDSLGCVQELLRVAKLYGKLQEVLGQRARDAHMWLPIHFAVYSGKKEVVKVLVEAGADLQKQDYYHFSCLHLAAEKDDAEMVELLLSYGMDPNERRRADNWSVLHHAASFCSFRASQVLLKRDANPNIQSKGFMFGLGKQRPIHVIGQTCSDKRKQIAMRELLQQYEQPAAPPYKVCTRARLNKHSDIVNKSDRSTSSSSTTSSLSSYLRSRGKYQMAKLINAIIGQGQGWQQIKKKRIKGFQNSNGRSWNGSNYSSYLSRCSSNSICSQVVEERSILRKQKIGTQPIILEVELQPWNNQSASHSTWRKFMWGCIS